MFVHQRQGPRPVGTKGTKASDGNNPVRMVAQHIGALRIQNGCLHEQQGQVVAGVRPPGDRVAQEGPSRARGGTRIEDPRIAEVEGHGDGRGGVKETQQRRDPAQERHGQDKVERGGEHGEALPPSLPATPQGDGSHHGGVDCHGLVVFSLLVEY